jgi:hypothetical protein
VFCIICGYFYLKKYKREKKKGASKQSQEICLYIFGTEKTEKEKKEKKRGGTAGERFLLSVSFHC